MKISHINNIEQKLNNLTDTIENCISPEDSEQDKQIQRTIDEKLKEVEQLIHALKINNNSSAAKFQKWFNDNLDKYVQNREYFDIEANENNFSLTIKPIYLNLNTIIDEIDDEHGDYEHIQNQEQYDIFETIQAKEGFTYRDNDESIKLEEKLESINKFITLQSKDIVYDDGQEVFLLSFKYTKKLFKDDVAANEVCDEWMKEVVNYFNDIRHRIEAGYYVNQKKVNQIKLNPNTFFNLEDF